MLFPNLLVVLAVKGSLCPLKAFLQVHNIRGAIQLVSHALLVLIQLPHLGRHPRRAICGRVEAFVKLLCHLTQPIQLRPEVVQRFQLRQDPLGSALNIKQLRILLSLKISIHKRRRKKTKTKKKGN